MIFLSVFGESIYVYHDPYSPIFTDKPIYSWTNKIKIAIIFPNWNTVETFKNSGSFAVTISLSQNSPSSGNNLYAMFGDEIFGKYDDHTLSKPFLKSDNSEIKISAKVDSYIPPIEKLNISPLTLSDNFGNSLELFLSNIQIQIVGTVINDNDFEQIFLSLLSEKY